MTTTTHDITAAGRHTYFIAERLHAIATDLLYTARVGHRALHRDDLPESLTITAHRADLEWGSIAQVWARNEQGHLHASAEASSRRHSISARIRHFRGSGLLWTHTAPPATTQALNARDPWAYNATGRHHYLLSVHPRLDNAPDWHLHTDHADSHRIFAGIESATTYIAETLEKPPTARRRSRRTTT
ncbi:hypothetical protein [Mycolicibacterium bacteremicum]|uniref:hypothetical protein n=1 Tax=Mycolicibacterium bacteremicum TaxID=564198 RepID=UPI0026F16C2E|nr:hypothetical protein [Mycolicibacterium bacteremicum]